MSAILEYQRVKREFLDFENLLALVGKPYGGGGGGIGGYVNAHFSVSIYHQEYDGATNYHEVEKSIQYIVNDAALKMAPQIMETVRKYLAEKLKSAAILARKESDQIAKDSE